MHPRQFFSLGLKAVALLLIGRGFGHVSPWGRPIRLFVNALMNGELADLIRGALRLSLPIALLADRLVFQIVAGVLLFHFSNEITKWFFRRRRFCRVCGFDTLRGGDLTSCPECLSPAGSGPRGVSQALGRRSETRAFARNFLRLAFCAIGALWVCQMVQMTLVSAASLVFTFMSGSWLSPLIVMTIVLFTLLLTAWSIYCLFGAPRVVDWLVPRCSPGVQRGATKE